MVYDSLLINIHDGMVSQRHLCTETLVYLEIVIDIVCKKSMASTKGLLVNKSSTMAVHCSNGNEDMPVWETWFFVAVFTNSLVYKQGNSASKLLVIFLG